MPREDHDLATDDHDLATDDHDLATDDHDLATDDHDLATDDHDLAIDDRPDPPAVPERRLDAGGWTLLERNSAARGDYPGGRVVGHTHVYEDAALRAALRSATDGALDRPWRVFFATRLEFRPPLAPGLDAAASPVVAAAADREFRADLRDRDFERVERRGSERLRLADGAGARLYRYDAVHPVPFGAVGTIDAGGLLAVRRRGDRYRLAGGAYPADGFGSVLDAAGVDDHDPDGYFEELVALIRASA